MSKQAKKEVTTHKGQEVIFKTDLASLATTSAKIRALTAEGLSRMQVSKVLGIRYQHVRNVLITPIKKA